MYDVQSKEQREIKKNKFKTLMEWINNAGESYFKHNES